MYDPEKEPFLKIPISVVQKLRKLRYSTQSLYGLFLEQIEWIPNLKPRRPQRGKDIFECPASMARKELGMAGDTYTKAVNEMVEYKFIRIHTKGQFPSEKGAKITSLYRLLIY